MPFISFMGIDINPEKIIAISEVCAISTGSLSCDWDFGFNAITEHGNIPFILDSPKDVYGNYLQKREDREMAAAKKEKSFWLF